jgi:hypothetical protein
VKIVNFKISKFVRNFVEEEEKNLTEKQAKRS